MQSLSGVHPDLVDVVKLAITITEVDFTVIEAMKTAAEVQEIPIVWGGDWKSFYDAPHFELNRKKYK